MKVCYRRLSEEEIHRALFAGFIRHQAVKDCWRKEDGAWVVREDPFIDDWSDEEYDELVKCLKHTVSAGGFVYAAFVDGDLKGFVSVEPELFGGRQRYLDLSSLHVSEEWRGYGIGRQLFEKAKDWARRQGGSKLYISAHSAVETQAFYRTMGCVEAREYAHTV